jgi:hypothetical protein
MRIDFHYYGAYVAARLAGYDFTEAQTIAFASQYVDESHLGMLRDSHGQYYIKDFSPIPTLQTDFEYLRYNTTEWSATNLLQTYRIYIPFHFLPGNYGRPDVLTHTGPKSDSAILSKWTFTAESENHVKLLCLPNSPLVKEMINDLVEHHHDDLQFIGLRIHVLADTWAHMYYAGIPAWYLNNAANEVNEVDTAGQKKPVVWGPRVWPLTDLFNPEEATPDAPYYNSYMYLGHGRMGHLPDYPYISYEYQPQWSHQPIVKDNRVCFLKAFKQLVMAMSCIRNKQPFDTDGYAQLAPEVEEIVNGVLQTRETNQSNTWKANIPRIPIDGTHLEVPEEFQADKWLTAFKQAGQSATDSDYYRFNRAAVRHLELVTHHLERHEQFVLSGGSGKHTLTVNLRHAKAGYLGTITEDLHTSGFTQYYAKMSSEAVPHRIIKIDSAPLRSGALVQIQTTEAKTGEYAYLGAWKTKALYYYKKDYEVDKQRWVIEKVDLAGDDIIRSGDRVRIKNLHFVNKSYLAPYGYLYWFKWRHFLTTRGKAEEWILEWSE